MPCASAYAASHLKPTVALNIQQGPLGVTLTVRGKNLHAGPAKLTYIDAHKVIGTFATSSQVQVQGSGILTATQLLLPESGPVGVWNIVVTDSAKTVAMAPYHVLASPGAAQATYPSIATNPTNGKAGDVIAVSGSNWFPQGTHVNLAYLDTSNALVSLDTTLISDKNGMVTGGVRIPSQFDGTQGTMTIVAADTTAAMKAQTALTVLSLTPTPTPLLHPTPTKALSTNVAPTNPKDPSKLSFTMSTTSLELTLLIVGGTLGVAALMLILFLIPWRKSFHEQATVPHKPYRR